MRWIKDSLAKRLSPLQQGLLGGAGALLFIGACLAPTLSLIAERPSPGLLRAMAAIAATLLVAYAVETSAAVRMSRGRNPTQENWIGAIVGAATSGLLGIAVALGLAERASVGHWSWLDDLAFAFSASASLLLGLFVVLLPLLSYEELRGALREDDD